MRINSIGRIRPAFMPSHVVNPRFITMTLLRGGGERVAEVIKPKFGREMLVKGAFKKNQGNGQGGADSLDIRQKGGMQRDSAGFGFFPFFLFCGLNGNKAGIVEGEGEHLTRAHTCENEKPETKLCTGLRLFCEKSADNRDFQKVYRISYWIYIPADTVEEGVTEVAWTDCPGVVFDDPVGDYKDRWIFFGKSDYKTDSQKVPVGVWTKMTVDCINAYPNVIVMTVPEARTVVYLDDIYVEETEERVDDYDYKFVYHDTTGNWLCGNVVTLENENIKAGDSVTITAKVATSLDGSDSVMTPILFNLPRKRANLAEWEEFGSGKTSVAKGATSGWREQTIKATVANDGKIYLSAGVLSEDGRAAYSLYLKDVSVSVDEKIECDYQAKYSSGSGAWFAGTAAKVLEGQTANATLTISLKVMTSIDGETSQAYLQNYSGTEASDSTYTVNGKDNNLLIDTATIGWKTVTMTVTAAADGCVYLGGAYRANDGKDFFLYMKDIQIVTA